MHRAARSAVAAALAACGPAAPTPAHAEAKRLRPSEIVEAPERFLGQTVEVEIVEHLWGAEGEPRAQRCVGLPEFAPCLLSLAPAAFEPGAPDRRTLRFEAPLRPPLRVRGVVVRDDGLTQHWPGYVIRVTSAEALAEEPATPVASVAELLAARERWDRRRVVVEGNWSRGFERSNLDGRDVWLVVGRDAEILGRPPKKPSGENRVRVTGLVFAGPKGRYGHMGGATLEIVASRVEYLGRPKR